MQVKKIEKGFGEARILSVDPLKCNGCKDCEAACSKKHSGQGCSSDPRIKIVSGFGVEGFYLPMTCQHCEEPPCLEVCPNQAIYRDEELNRVMIRRELCVGCQMCVSACPSGAMRFDHPRGLAFKCDLCDGDPECVRACEPKALTYVSGFELHRPRLQESAKKHFKVMRNMAV
jgi:Fe-S-cluster-containing hydrogenase component 2